MSIQLRSRIQTNVVVLTMCHEELLVLLMRCWRLSCLICMTWLRQRAMCASIDT